jgi:hypothetical protein
VISWRGAGCLSLLLPFIGFAAGMILGDHWSETGQGLAVATGLILGSAIVLGLGLAWNSPRKVVEQARAHGLSEDELAELARSRRSRHTLYDLPMQWIGLAGIVFGLILGFVAWQEEHGLPDISNILMPLTVGGILLVAVLALNWSKRRKK